MVTVCINDPNYSSSLKQFGVQHRNFSEQYVSLCNQIYFEIMQLSAKDLASLLKPESKKNKESVRELINSIFKDPKDLVKKIQNLSKECSKGFMPNKSKIDIQILEKIYNLANSYQLNNQVSTLYKQSFDKLHFEGELKAFVSSEKEMKYFFIAILWNKLFSEDQNKSPLFMCLNLIKHSIPFHDSFTIWCEDLSANYLTNIVSELHKVLQAQIEKLLPNVIPQESLPIVRLNIENICCFLKMLSRSNNQNKRVPEQVFVYNNMGTYFQPLGQIKLHMKGIKQLNFIAFPFLLPLDYKYQLLRIESIIEQQLNMKKSMESGFSGMIQSMIQMNVNGAFSLENLIFLHFQISRQNILDDSMEKLYKVKANLKSPLRIKFIGEEGSDDGGITNEYFQLITKEIFNPYLDMFLPKCNGRIYWFNGFSFEPPIRFQFVGMLLGLAIYNQVHLNIKFPNILYKKLLCQNEKEEQKMGVMDLREIEPEISKSLRKILDEKGPLDNLLLFFNVELESFGEKIVQELIENGNNIPVTHENKYKYVRLYSNFLLNKHTEKQFRAFKKGFRRVVTGAIIDLFRYDELKKIICGSENIDFEELKAHTNYQGGYTADSPVIKNLWQILLGFNLEEKKAFLMFTTGTDRVPIDGLKSLKFLIQRHSNTGNLPTAHTCFNVLLLPEYQSKQKLQKNIRIILQNNQGFGLI